LVWTSSFATSSRELYREIAGSAALNKLEWALIPDVEDGASGTNVVVTGYGMSTGADGQHSYTMNAMTQVGGEWVSFTVSAARPEGNWRVSMTSTQAGFVTFARQLSASVKDDFDTLQSDARTANINIESYGLVLDSEDGWRGQIRGVRTRDGGAGEKAGDVVSWTRSSEVSLGRSVATLSQSFTVEQVFTNNGTVLQGTRIRGLTNGQAFNDVTFRSTFNGETLTATGNLRFNGTGFDGEITSGEIVRGRTSC
jgi:hypothetical protein